MCRRWTATRSATEDLHELPASLKIVGESFAGAGWQGTVEAGTCARIFTGAPVPAGADRVVDPGKCPPRGRPRDHRRCPGDRRLRPPRAARDFETGEVLLPAGRRLDARAIVAAAAADLAEVEVYRQPRVHVLARAMSWPSREPRATGPMPIPDSVSLGVAAARRAIGAPMCRHATGCATICRSMEEAARAAIEGGRDRRHRRGIGG